MTEEMIEGAGLVVLTDAPLETAIPGNLGKKKRKKVARWNSRTLKGSPSRRWGTTGTMSNGW